MKKRLAVLISGGGTNLQAILDACKKDEINAEVVLVVSSNAQAYGLTRAKNFGIGTVIAQKSDYESNEKRDEYILKELKTAQPDFIVLAGYLGILTDILISAYPKKIINIHPALLPSFGGKNFHGLNVHKAVIEAGEKYSGATVHFVDSGIDTGEILAQEKLAVLDSDTPESLQQRILETIEHKLLIGTLKELCK